MTNPLGQELSSGRDSGQQRSLTSGQMAWFRFRSNPSSIIGAFIVFSVILLAIFAPLIAPSPQSAGSFVDFINRHSPPSRDFWFGTETSSMTENIGVSLFNFILLLLNSDAKLIKILCCS